MYKSGKPMLTRFRPRYCTRPAYYKLNFPVILKASDIIPIECF